MFFNPDRQIYLSRQMNKTTVYLIFYSITFFIFFGMHLYLYIGFNRFFDFLKPQIMIMLCAVMALSFPVCSILERCYPSGVTGVLYAVASLWLGVLFLLLTALIIYEPVRLFLNIDSIATGLILIAGVLLVSLYALINASLVSVKVVEISLPNLAVPLKMVQLSDIHVGTIHNTKYLSRIVEKTNALNPDMIVITGDFIDGIGVVNRKTVEPLKKLKARTFFIIGNHERYGNLDHIGVLMKEAGVRVLRNEIVEYRGIQLVGADYPEKDNMKDTPFLRALRVKREIPSVLLYHKPSAIECAVRAGINLQVSGHTHNGQLFPFNLITKLFFPYINGLYEVDGMYLYVSPGTGTWGPPMRLGSENEITLFKLGCNGQLHDIM